MRTEVQAPPASQCPSCAYGFDAATCLEDEKSQPSAGDLSICIRCGELLTYAEDLTIRSAELSDLLKLPERLRGKLYRAQELIRERQHGGPK